LSTGLLFGVFICRLVRKGEALQSKMKMKMIATHQAASLKGIEP
jgi:hypothetical protein